jgi:hypothetical protein
LGKLLLFPGKFYLITYYRRKAGRLYVIQQVPDPFWRRYLFHPKGASRLRGRAR